MAEDTSAKRIVRGNPWYHGSVLSDREAQTFRIVVKCGAVGIRLSRADNQQGQKKDASSGPEE